GTLSTVDPDDPETFVYTLEADPTGKFEIDGATLQLKPGEKIDFETTPSVELLVRSTDHGGLYFEKSLTITVNDAAESLVAAAGDWTAAGLTLKLGVDGKLHLYQTGTTDDAVPPHVPANVTDVQITGRDDADDALTVDFSGGAPIPAGGLVFQGGTQAVGDAFFLVGTATDDDATLTGTEVVLSGLPGMSYSGVEFFGFDMGGGNNSLFIDHATLKINADDAISTGTDVTVDDGTLDLDGKAVTLGEFVLFSGNVAGGTLFADSYQIESGTVAALLAGPGELVKTTSGSADAGLINAANVTVEAGQLTAASITTGTLTIGGGAAAAKAPPTESAETIAASAPAAESSVPIVPAPVVEIKPAAIEVFVDGGSEGLSRTTIVPSLPADLSGPSLVGISAAAPVSDSETLRLDPAGPVSAFSREVRPVEPMFQAVAAAQQSRTEQSARRFPSSSPLSAPVVDQLFGKWLPRGEEPGFGFSISDGKSPRKDQRISFFTEDVWSRDLPF
ncbi:MAG: cadherin repeat domain-containing protein, partial [Pirellulales bacterium]|nr:cadherin repeat domain-containing protein [Pirellulales bacterium]